MLSLRSLTLLFSLCFVCLFASAETMTIHVFVALCDNKHQGIVPVPEKIGNGKDPRLNLYWGAGYGVKSFFKLKTDDWELVSSPESDNPYILERVLFKHATQDVYLLADAYDGERIKDCVEDFLLASNTQNTETVTYNGSSLSFGGSSDLVSYIGHDGLMEFSVDLEYIDPVSNGIDVIILACYSHDYFSPEIEQTGANPLLWTTHLMAPEAYTLKSAIDGWLLGESGKQIDERAAITYQKYQKCSLKGAHNLFTTGFN
ncbi:MAG: hypothetical protein MK081_08635 [Flavobacteriales bacterium]|nr:hypothetical protein [Flavobacteriales bacterium]